MSIFAAKHINENKSIQILLKIMRRESIRHFVRYVLQKCSWNNPTVFHYFLLSRRGFIFRFCACTNKEGVFHRYRQKRQILCPPFVGIRMTEIYFERIVLPIVTMIIHVCFAIMSGIPFIWIFRKGSISPLWPLKSNHTIFEHIFATSWIPTRGWKPWQPDAKSRQFPPSFYSS